MAAGSSYNSCQRGLSHPLHGWVTHIQFLKREHVLQSDHVGILGVDLALLFGIPAAEFPVQRKSA